MARATASSGPRFLRRKKDRETHGMRLEKAATQNLRDRLAADGLVIPRVQ